MVEYTCEDAIELLTKSKASAESRLRETNVRKFAPFSPHLASLLGVLTLILLSGGHGPH